MRISSLAKIMIGIENIVVKDVSFDEDAWAIRPYRPHSCRCGKCGQKAPLLRCRQGNQALEMSRCRRHEGVYPGGCIQGEVPKMRYRGAEAALGRPW